MCNARRLLEHEFLPSIMIVLDYVNLKDRERRAIELVDLKGQTNEEAAIKLECSIKTVYTYRRSAINKINKCIEKNKFILDILEG